MSKSWSGIQHLTRPVPAAELSGPLIDTFYRKRMSLWIVWSLLPPDDDGNYKSVILLGAFRDRIRARFAADTAYVACRSDSTFLPMMRELIAESGDFLDVLHAVSHYADAAPWTCAHRPNEKVFGPLSNSDLEALTSQIEKKNDAIQDWRFAWAGHDNVRFPTLIRIKNRSPAAAIVINPETFRTGNASVWLDNEPCAVPCQPMAIDLGAPLCNDVLDNLMGIMQYCDDVLASRYGVDTNGPDLISTLKEENYREAYRQIARAFGTSRMIGEA